MRVLIQCFSPFVWLMDVVLFIVIYYPPTVWHVCLSRRIICNQSNFLSFECLSIYVCRSVLCCLVLSVVSGQEKLENVFFLLLAICVCSSVFCSPPHLPFPFNASTHQLHHLDARFRSVSLGSAYFHSISVRRHVAGHSRVKWIRCACFFCIRSCRLISSLHILVHGNY